VIPDLVYDVGLHDGSDTAFYLHRGFRVLAIEANPVLVADARWQFASEVAAGRLTIMNVGVAARAGSATFWVHERKTQYSSFVRELGCRNGGPCRPVEVECVRFGDVVAAHGVPYYLKIDIESSDRLCLADLSPVDLPRYVSIEADSLDDLLRLRALGYNAFKCINQRNHNDPATQRIDNESRLAPLHAVLEKNPQLRRALARLGWRRFAIASRPDGWIFPRGSSGPFGDESFGPWDPFELVADAWRHHALGHTRRGTLNPRGWYDFHATVLPEPPPRLPPKERHGRA